MKEDYFDKAISFGGLYKGLKKSCRNVRWKDSVVGYEANGLANTLKLSSALKEGKYRISRYQEFTIYEPKKRVILASRLVDRQFQRSLCDSGLYQDITEHLIRDNVACQIGCGTDDALNRLKIHMMRYYRKEGNHGWVLKCDIKRFFPSTDHDIAKKAVLKYVSDKRAAKAVCDVIDSFGGSVGIGLGSQISQLVELLVLNDLDHFIKERLKIRAYIRYMDDFILIDRDEEYLRHCKDEIKKKLAELKLELNDKTCLFPLEQGITFLQWKFALTNTGKVIMKMKREKYYKQRKRMKKLAKREREGTVREGTVRESLRSFLANAERGNTWVTRNKIKVYYKELTGEDYEG